MAQEPIDATERKTKVYEMLLSGPVRFSRRDSKTVVTYSYDSGIQMSNIENPTEHPRYGENFFEKVESDMWEIVSEDL